MKTTRTIPWPAIGFALIWVAAASLVDETTFHLAPLIVAGAVPFTSRSPRPVAAAAGFGFAVVVTIALALAGRLDGPSLLPIGDAVLESVVAAALGAAAAAAWSTTPLHAPASL